MVFPSLPAVQTREARTRNLRILASRTPPPPPRTCVVRLLVAAIFLYYLQQNDISQFDDNERWEFTSEMERPVYVFGKHYPVFYNTVSTMREYGMRGYTRGQVYESKSKLHGKHDARRGRTRITPEYLYQKSRIFTGEEEKKEARSHSKESGRPPRIKLGNTAPRTRVYRRWVERWRQIGLQIASVSRVRNFSGRIVPRSFHNACRARNALCDAAAGRVAGRSHTS